MAQKSVSSALLKIAEGLDLFHDPQGDVFATIGIDGHRETWSIRSRSFRKWIVLEHFLREGKPHKNDALKEALSLIEARGTFEGPEHETFVRVAGGEDGVVQRSEPPSLDTVAAGPQHRQMRTEPTDAGRFQCHRDAFHPVIGFDQCLREV